MALSSPLNQAEQAGPIAYHYPTYSVHWSNDWEQMGVGVDGIHDVGKVDDIQILSLYWQCPSMAVQVMSGQYSSSVATSCGLTKFLL